MFTIIKYGDVGDKYFVLARGEVIVQVYEPGTAADDPNLSEKIKVEKKLCAEPDKMIGFGEIALLLNDKRTATVMAHGKEGS